MFLKLAKFSYLFFIFYIIWIQNAFYAINNAPLILGISMMGFLLLHIMNSNGKFYTLKQKPVLVYFIFSFYILFTGYIVAVNKTLLISSVLTFFQIVLMMIFIIEVSIREKSTSFFLKSYTVLAIVYAINLVFWGFDNGGITTISPTSNPNGDGLILLFGIFCLLMLLDNKYPIRFIAFYVAVGFLFYAIVLTGSRKSFLFAILLVLLWLIFVFKYHWMLSSFMKKMLLSFLIMISFGIVATEFLPLIFDSALYTRLSGGLTGGDQIRKAMYSTALEYFYSNPIVGIGFNQFKELSPWKTYSHSTYAEIISTTGIIGSILYFIPYFFIIYNLLSIYRNEKQTTINAQALFYLILMAVMLALGTGVIYFYDIISNIMLALMISFYLIQKTRLKGEIKLEMATNNN
jgi:O-antigen ligase